MESKSALSAMQKLESRSDEELEAETRFRAAAQAILGARAAERMDAKRSREHFRAAIAAARPQERLQLRRMAEASLALAERRAGDLKVAAEKLGQTPPTNRQLLALRFMGLVAPPPGAPLWLRARGILIILVLVLTGFRPDAPAAFKAFLTNPVPRGDIETSGEFGPWLADDPATTET